MKCSYLVHIFSISSAFTILCLLYRKSTGALHHGGESIGHVGPGLLDAAAASLSERCPEASRPKTSHLSKPTFPVSPPQTG